jgi:hypothetical protein
MAPSNDRRGWRRVTNTIPVSGLILNQKAAQVATGV